MTQADSGTRIDELKARWEADPSSRVFVQLAEEYRRQGRTDDAIAVLEKGLAEQPNYVSALVALGRCRLDAGDASGAVEILSRVTEQDASHPLAGKLLVEAHLQTGQTEEAAKRLDLYRMMADSDPEIEELESRLREARDKKSAGGPVEPETDEAPEPVAPEPVAPEVAVAESVVAGLEDLELSFEDPEGTALSRAGSAAGTDDVFDLGPSEPAPPEDGPFELSERPAAPAVPVSEVTDSAPSDEPFHLAPPPPAAPGASEAGAGEPFGDLLGDADLQSWSEGLGGDRVFELAEPETEPPPLSPAREKVAGEDREEATVTLGRLYMAQGHHAEAVRIFRSILERDPDNEISRKALAELVGEGPEAAGPEPRPVSVPVRAVEEEEGEEVTEVATERREVTGRRGVTERKIAMLEDYLQRLRRATGT